MDIYGDDIDTLLQNDDDDDNNDEMNENIRGEDVGEENEDSEKKTDSEPIKVEPKKRAVRNPQVSCRWAFSYYEWINLIMNENIVCNLASSER